MKKILSLVMLVILVTSGCSDETDSKELTEINLGVMPSMSAASFIYASEEGFYEQYGLDVNVQVFNSTPDLNAALEAGELTAINNDFPSAILMADDGDDIAISMSTNDVFTLVSSPESGYETIDEIDIGTLALMEVSVTEYISKIIEDENNIDFELMHIPSLGDRYTSLMAGDVDFAILCVPFAGLVAVEGGNTLWSNDNGPFLTTLSWNREFVDGNAQAYTDFHQATDDAISEIINSGFDSYKDYLVEYQILTDENVELVSEQPFLPVTPADSEVFEDVEDWMSDRDLIDSEVEYDDVFVDWR